MGSGAVVKSPRRVPMPAEERLRSNGIDGATGGDLTQAMTLRQVAELALADGASAADPGGSASKAPIAGVDPDRLDHAGWAVVLPEKVDPAVREALEPLLEHRRAQADAGRRSLYSELTWRRGESKIEFLARHDAGPGPVDPARVPYYLLLAGSPEEIPFELQYQLGVQYAVGRLHFETAEAWASYACSAVEAETKPVMRSIRAGFFGVENPGDDVTRRLKERVIEPLALRFERRLGGSSLRLGLGAQATKAELGRWLASEPPALLMTGSHGMGFPSGDPRQREAQGALLCADWPGRESWSGPIPEEHYFAAADVPAAADLRGMVAFHFACYSAGVPRRQDFGGSGRALPRRLAPRSFLARLPERLLERGALAVFGHVERAWNWSFEWAGTDEPQVQTFESALGELFDGRPVGAAFEVFHRRYAELAADLAEERRRWQRGESRDPKSIALVWTAMQDARNHLLLGDPAVRLAPVDTANEES